MGCLSVDTRSKVILITQNGYPIQKRLLEEGVQVSKVSLFARIDLPKKPRPSKLSECHYRFIDEVMTADNELMSRQLFFRFCATYPEVQVSFGTVK